MSIAEECLGRCQSLSYVIGEGPQTPLKRDQGLTKGIDDNAPAPATPGLDLEAPSKNKEWMLLERNQLSKSICFNQIFHLTLLALLGLLHEFTVNGILIFSGRFLMKSFSSTHRLDMSIFFVSLSNCFNRQIFCLNTKMPDRSLFISKYHVVPSNPYPPKNSKRESIPHCLSKIVFHGLPGVTSFPVV